jgi:hypothetical protein
VRLKAHSTRRARSPWSGICGICGLEVDAREVTIDHIVPLARGGTDARTNQQPAHLHCNRWKADRTADELIGAACSLETRAEVTTIVLQLYQEELRDLKRLFPASELDIAARSILRSHLAAARQSPPG